MRKLGVAALLISFACAPPDAASDRIPDTILDSPGTHSLPGVEPEAAGLSAAPLARFDSIAMDYVAAGRVAGLVAFVVRHGQVAHETVAGVMDVDTDVPMRPDAIFRIASQTKIIVGVATMILVEEGRLDLADPVAASIPAFAETTVAVPSGDTAIIVPADRPITILDLLTHTAGIPGPDPDYFVALYEEAGLTSGKGLLNALDEPVGTFSDRLATLPFMVQPGERPVYGYSTDVLGAVVERASGMPLDVFLEQRVFAPLGMVDTHFFLPVEKVDRLVANHLLIEGEGLRRARDDDMSWDGQGAFVDGPRRLFSGNGGLLSTASDFARFLQMLVNEGVLDGERILTPASVQALTLNRVGDFYDEFYPGLGWGFSVEVKLDPEGEGYQVPSGASPGAFAWGGAAYTGFWVDPEQQLVGIFMAQQRPGDPDLHRRFGDAVYDALAEGARSDAPGG